jgi:type VI protein secretion system component VasF
MTGFSSEFTAMLKAFQQQGKINAQAAEQRFRQQQVDDMNPHEDALKARQHFWQDIQEYSQIFCRNLCDSMGTHTL